MSIDNYNNKKIVKSLRSLLSKKSIGRSLALWFISISIIPIITISIINNKNTYQKHLDSTSRQLKDIARIKGKEIENYFNNMLLQIAHESRQKSTLESILKLKYLHKNSGLKTDKFVRSPIWHKLTDKYCQNLVTFTSTFDYYDLYLMDTKGNILYTIEQEDDLGTNIINGKYSNTKFSQACKKTLEEEKFVFSDFEKYIPSNNLPAAFIVSVIYNNNKRKIGLLALQLSILQIDDRMQQKSGLGSMGETYLIGKDLKMRSNSILSDEFTILEDTVKTEQAILWYNKHIKDEVVQKDEKPSIYKGPTGNDVIGVYYHLNFLTVPMAVIAEIETEDVFSHIRDARITNFILLCITILFAIIISIFVTNRFVKPIRKITEWARRFAVGDLVYEEIVSTEDEIEKLNDSFKDVVNTTRAVAKISQAIAIGDFSESIEERSDMDLLVKSINQMRINLLDVEKQAGAISRGDYSADIKPMSNKDSLRIALRKMTESLRESRDNIEKQDWLKSGIAGLSNSMRGNQNLDELCGNILVYITKHIDAQIGIMYTADEEGNFILQGSFASSSINNLPKKFKSGEGLIGQAVIEKKEIILEDIPEDYMKIRSGLGDMLPKTIITIPLFFDQKVNGIIELASLKAFETKVIEYMKTINEPVAISINSAHERERKEKLLIQTREQQKKLSAAYTELEERAHKLKESEEQLRTQQEELRATNEELEEKTEHLEKQKNEFARQNIELDRARLELEKKAKDLEITSKYKSQFLANMSHELRTPLNSLLVLSQGFVQNKEENLTKEQVEEAMIILKSGNDLLTLINEILDLSKIEAGKIDINLENILFEEFNDSMKGYFNPIIKNKNLELNTQIDENLPVTIKTDGQRLSQIIKNFISNSIKFTETGSINLHFHKPEIDADLRQSNLDPAKSVAISVVDTGIGISPNKQKIIFEAFQQADGSTSRKYGGTGLGLSISRELASLLGGEIQLESEIGKGSVFTLYLPEKITEDELREKATIPERRKGNRMSDLLQELDTQEFNISPDIETDMSRISIKDDKDNINKNDNTILVIEDDQNFANVLYKFCHEKKFKCIHSYDGETGLQLAEEYNPDGIFLDLKLPKMDGWNVLFHLKENIKTRHIPVHIMSAEVETLDVFNRGAIGYLSKPIDRDNLHDAFDKIKHIISKEKKNLLIIENDKEQQKYIQQLIGKDIVELTTATSGNDAINIIKTKQFDCIILDLMLPDMTGSELLSKIDAMEDLSLPPIIIYTDKDISTEERGNLEKFKNLIIQTNIKTEAQLIDEASLFLHMVINDLPEDKKKMIANFHNRDDFFKNKKILVVDDDMRNVFTIARFLEKNDMIVYKAADGIMALKILEEEPEIDIVLMDIMMPEMDGYECIKKIRKQKRFKKLPILTLTAKAMKGDREKSISAGANDYITKPLNTERLLTMMRVWLYK